MVVLETFYIMKERFCILQKIWGKLKTRQNLPQMEPEKLIIVKVML
uniref:Uncharacterized protein n=1 Tax=Rhizophora mucronata TaxID=61149 RepID=A0A2P2M3M7_RHIMU